MHLVLGCLSTVLIWFVYFVHWRGRRRLEQSLPGYRLAIEAVAVILIGLTAHLGGFLSGGERSRLNGSRRQCQHLTATLARLPSLIYTPTMMARKSFDLAVIEFAQSIGLLVRRVRAAAAPHELSLTEAAIMARLAKEGPATIADLARAESMKPQSMGTTIAGLEEGGMIERKPHPTDGRQMNIALTAKGAVLRDSFRDAKRNWLAHAISQLDEEEKETLFKAAVIIKRLAEQ